MLSKRLVVWAAYLSVIVLMAIGFGCTPKHDNDQKASANSGQADTSIESLIVYSSRKEHLVKPVFDLYTEKTGIPIQFITDKAGVLVERLKAEGANSKADIFITVDAGTLGYAASLGLFQPLDSSIIKQNVVEYLRDEEDRWVGLSLRARTIVFSTDRVDSDELTTYAALGDAEWKNRLCLRTSKKVYNQSLVAMLISEMGEEKAEAVVSSWVNNLAIPPTSNDTKVMSAIQAGQCDVGIVNSYYFGRLQTKDPDITLALFWPNQQIVNSGVHVNVAGAGILKHSKNAKAARDFIEWLVSGEAQAIFAGVNQEYPINKEITVDNQVASWGKFKASQLPLSDAYKLQPTAVKLMDRAGYK